VEENRKEEKDFRRERRERKKEKCKGIEKRRDMSVVILVF
jgi:hypothetical protein